MDQRVKAEGSQFPVTLLHLGFPMYNIGNKYILQGKEAASSNTAETGSVLCKTWEMWGSASNYLSLSCTHNESTLGEGKITKRQVWRRDK